MKNNLWFQKHIAVQITSTVDYFTLRSENVLNFGFHLNLEEFLLGGFHPNFPSVIYIPCV